MSSTVDLVEKNKVLLELIDTGNAPNKIIDEIRKNKMGADLHKLKLIRKPHLNNLIIGYLNLNSLRNKMHEMREVFGDLSPDYFVLAETKINDEFADSQFLLENYEIHNRCDRTKNGGGLIEYVRKGLPHQTMKIFQTKESESIFSEITVKNIKWFVVGIYRLPNDSNMNKFFEEMTTSLDMALQKYGNCIIMGDFNIDMDKSDSPACAQLNDFCDIFDLANMINEKTCFSKNHSSRIDLILSNKPSSFQLSRATETGLSDCHKLITTCMKATISCLKP